MSKRFEFLEGHSVTRLCFGHSVFIECFDKSVNTTVRIEQTINLIDKGKSTAIPYDDVESASHLLRLLKTQVKKAEASDDGTLCIDFSQNRSLTVSPHPHYEAWELYSNNGLKVVCAPGGELVVWSPLS